MSKHFAKLGTLCVVGALALAPAAGAYSVPKPKGGGSSTKAPTTAVGKKIVSKGPNQLAKVNSIKVSVKFAKAGKYTITLNIVGGPTLGTGSATGKAGQKKTVTIKFTSAGKAFLAKATKANIKITTTFKPKTGKTVTSTTTIHI